MNKEIEEVLNKLAQEKGEKDWQQYAIEGVTDNKWVTSLVERAVELGFVAGQKQKEKEMEDIIEQLLWQPEKKRIETGCGEHSAFVLGFDTAMARLKKRLQGGKND